MAAGQTTLQWMADKFCSNITHIANSYPSTIHVSLQTSQLSISEGTLSVQLNSKPGATIGGKLTEVTNISWIRIPQHDYHRIDRVGGNHYITIVAECGPSKGDPEIILYNYVIQPSQSFIITSNGGFKLQKYGSRNLFEDFAGVDHTPK